MLASLVFTGSLAKPALFVFTASFAMSESFVLNGCLAMPGVLPVSCGGLAICWTLLPARSLAISCTLFSSASFLIPWLSVFRLPAVVMFWTLVLASPDEGKSCRLSSKFSLSRPWRLSLGVSVSNPLCLSWMLLIAMPWRLSAKVSGFTP